MSAPPRTSDNLGFLTVIDHPRYGPVGGYLVLNETGRPLEFLCTTPIKRNRTQEIFYGKTFRPFLYGEQIGQTLLNRSKTETLFVLTDIEPVLAAQDFVEKTLVFVFGAQKTTETTQISHISEESTCQLEGVPGLDIERWKEVKIGKRTVAVPYRQPVDWDRFVDDIQHVSRTLDIAEPFTRIRLAIEEANKAG